MNGQQITNKLQEKYPTMEVDFNKVRNQVNVYGFHTLENATAARAEMEAMGFELAPNGGRLKIEEKEEEIEIDHDVTVKDAKWLSMTAEQRRDSIANNKGIAMAQDVAKARYESGNLSDESVAKRMWAPRYEAAIKYLEGQS